jgi:hypothetical protein
VVDQTIQAPLSVEAAAEVDGSISTQSPRNGFDPIPLFALVLQKSDGICDGMAQMTHRTTFALDEPTAKRLKRLSSKWQVSQAEVVRRSLEQAERADAAATVDPVALLEQLHAEGAGLAAEAAASYLSEMREDRRQWRGDSR